MAIPGWLWPEDDATGQRGRDSSRGVEDAMSVDVQRATSVFGLLSNATRVEILTSLSERDEPIAYTDLREETSIEDKGQFNYHLRQLEEFVERDDGEYALTARGKALVGTVRSQCDVLDSK